MGRDPVEPVLMNVDRAGRLVIPRALCDLVGWISGSEQLGGWLLMSSPGRYRLLSAAETEGDPDLARMGARIAGKAAKTEGTMLDFEDDASAVLGFRLMAIQLSPPPPGWRLTLPGAIAKLMHVRSAESEVALLVSDGHIEIWSLENLRSALSAPPSEIV